MEKWKDICFVEKGITYDYKDLYQVSNQGRIKRLSRTIYLDNGKYDIEEKVLKPSTTKKGYFRIGLRKDNKTKFFKVHRIVANVFIPNSENKPQINHINGVKTDNRTENLEWCTCKENVQHSVENGTFKRSCKKIA
jgi:hypothetical protein